jgi:predicted TIM-barrel fold metal-dependent hydrolase
MTPPNKTERRTMVDTMGFNAIGVRAAIELCGVDRVVFGSDFGPVPYGIKEQVQSVEEGLPSLADRQLVFWKTSNKIFRLGLSNTGEQLIPTRPPASKAA